MRGLLYSILASGIIFIGAVFMTAFDTGRSNQTRVIFLDVGQGDGILITRGSQQILIDGGVSERVLLEKLGRYMPFWDRTLDVMIATHPDADHIAAQIGVFGMYDVPIVIVTDAFKQSRVATAWHSALTKSRAQVIDANESVIVQIEEGNDAAGIMHVLFPRGATNVPAIKDVNDTSIVTHLSVGDTTFLMMGDLSQKQERNITVPAVSVLKVGHHGSKTSSSKEFIARVRPQEAIISAGRDNRYGHPTQEVLERLVAHGAKVLRTDDMGDIVYYCDKEESCTR